MTSEEPQRRVGYIPHLLERLGKRRIAEADVEAVLAAPEDRHPTYDYREALYATVRGRTLKVVIAEGSSPPIVITAMWLSRRRARR